ncbi:hypothetical protein BDW74DRAFT_183617 [Aspergillus multicolor]|uniref:uncharacterized protein n=1 Tax=Aspergillus multicolor TaxID=41759 RepID=UPI003CCD2BEE
MDAPDIHFSLNLILPNWIYILLPPPCLIDTPFHTILVLFIFAILWFIAYNAWHCANATGYYSRDEVDDSYELDSTGAPDTGPNGSR